MQASPELLSTLLKDHTTSRGDAVCNIFWATSDYEYLGKGYGYHDPILPELITGDNGRVIMPRVLKHKDTQSARVRDMAEVFTPAWVCNAQNNLIDEDGSAGKTYSTRNIRLRTERTDGKRIPKESLSPKERHGRIMSVTHALKLPVAKPPISSAAMIPQRAQSFRLPTASGCSTGNYV